MDQRKLKARDIYGHIDSFAPYSSQFPWDNSGLTAGSLEDEVSSVLLCLDCTNAAVKYASENSFDMIVSHHPMLFHPAKYVERGTALYNAVQSGVCVLSAHTNLDMAPGGVNDILAAKAGLKNVKVLCAEGLPMMRMGDTEPCAADELAGRLSAALGTHVKYSLGGRKISSAAVCGGSGGEYIDEVFAAGCDCLITGEAKHHQYLRAAELGITMMVAGHYETENPVMRALEKSLKEAFPGIRTEVFDEQPTSAVKSSAEQPFDDHV